MERIGVRELKARASEVVSAVRERRVRYLITWRGRPAAMLVPVEGTLSEHSADEVWARLESLGEEIARNWESEKSAVEILAEIRR